MTTLVASPTPHPTTTTTTASHPYTCNTCQVAFKSSDGQRNHMHTDWHRYNLKRRIAELPPITSELFAEKVLTSQAADRAARDRASFEKSCQPCGKVYYSQNAYNNHVNSQKHKQRVHALTKSGLIHDGAESVMSSTFSMDDTEDGTSTPVPEVSAAAKEEDDAAVKAELSSLVSNLSISSKQATGAAAASKPETDKSRNKAQAGDDDDDDEEGLPSLPITECLFCAHPSPTLQQNLTHMSKLHGLFIPEQPFLVNLEGLIRYLGQKILVGHTCLYCNKAKGGLDGIRTHMRDKGHCMIAFETEAEMLEIGEFYDFRSTYNPDEEDEWESDDDGEGAETWEDEMGNKTTADKSWETDSDASSCDSAEIGSLKVASVLGEAGGPGKGRKLSHHRTSSSHHQEDGWHSHAHSHSHTHASHLPHHHMQTVYFTETEMHLGNGRSVGHRSLARYYRQNLRDHPSYGEQERDALAIEDGDAEDVIEEEETEEGTETRLTQAQRRANKAALISRADGGQGLALASKTAKERAKKMEKKDRAVEQRGRERYQAKIEKQANNQKHYRDPNLQ
ncbi:hypothetical protein TWF718_009931 [Orbilia javanica]|uniref:C2H2-type domain-containing protein n=1 Tax=Orbilia javanica TaxID=47235 RepID=A0AAN8NRA6_9PEZI